MSHNTNKLRDPEKGKSKKGKSKFWIYPGAGAGPGGAAPPPLGILYILASFLDIPLNGKRVNPKRVNPKFGFTLFGFTLLRVPETYNKL